MAIIPKTLYYFIIQILVISITNALPQTTRDLIPLKDITKSSRIINGAPADIGQFPWQVAIYINSFTFCGGALIGDEWVLTAAHCADSGNYFDILLGTNALDAVVVTKRQVKTVIVHENYTARILENDIALLQLDFPVLMSDTIATIELDSEFLDADLEVTVSGWGKLSDAMTDISNELNFVNLTTITNSDCQSYYSETMDDGRVCCTGQDPVRSTCNGDSGGPLVKYLATKPIHVGIVSFVSIQGCESGYPSGYVRTAYYRNWIQEKSGI